MKTHTNFLAKVLSSLLLAALLSACDNKKNKEVKPEAEFFRIYENQKYLEAFYPTDIKKISDGYLIQGKRKISSSSFYGAYLLKVDQEGKFVSETVVGEQYVNPLPGLFQVNGVYYFVCMDPVSLETKIMSVSESGEVRETGSIAGILLPVAASLSSNQLLLLSYDKEELQMEVSLSDINGNLSGFEEFDIGFGDIDIEEIVLDHLTGTGASLPFRTGTMGGGRFYYNGYNLYNFNTTFFTFGSANRSALQGYRNERFVSSLEPMGGSRFATVWTDNGTHKVNTNLSFNYSTTGNFAGVNTIQGNLLLDLSPSSLPLLKRMAVAGRNLLVLGATSSTGKIALHFYDESSGAFVASKYLGYSHAYSFGNLEVSDDGGLLVTGSVLLEGRFPRVCLFKLSEEQLKEVLDPSED
ncbi:MAG: hypothetical protein MUF42_12710 [Cytophagaceae bacterium]|jgi:hypothetical protein|nr:hypothetical protein [Cytophagaceae bacterium]